MHSESGKDCVEVIRVTFNDWEEVDLCALLCIICMYLPARRRPQGLVVIGVCLSVCLCVSAHSFVHKISQERVHGSPPNLVGGSRG